MRAKDQLFDLVQCLSSSEKRQFKIQLQKYNNSKEGNLVRLFDAFNKLEYFCEEELYKALEGDKILKNFSYEKHRLQSSIIGFLQIKDQDSDIKLKIHKLFAQFYILIGRKQFGLSYKILEKAIKLAEDKSCYMELTNLMRYQFYLVQRVDYGNVERAQSINDSFAEITKKVHEENLTIVMRHNAALFTMKEGKEENEERKKEVLSYLDIQEDLYSSKEAQLNILNAKHFVCSVTEDERMMEVLVKMNDLISQDSSILASRYRTYIGNLFYLSQNYLLQKSYKETLKYLYKAKKFTEEYKELMEMRTLREVQGEILYILTYILLDSHNYDFLGKVFFKQKDILLEYFALSIRNIKSEYCYFLEMLMHFNAKNYEAVMDLINHLECEKEKKINVDCLYACKMIFVLSLFEKKEFQLMRSQFSNLYYFARNHNLEEDFFKLSLKILRKLSNESETPFTKFRKNLKSLKTVSNINIYGSQFFTVWLESKIQDVSLTTMIETKRLPIDEKQFLALLN